MILRQEVKTRLAGSERVRVAGSRPQGPVGQVSRGLGARAPRAWARPTRGPGAFFSPQKPQIRFFVARRGCRLKRLLRRWGPGGKRSRDTPPTPPPSPHPPILGLRDIQHAPQGRRTPETLNPRPGTLNPKP